MSLLSERLVSYGRSIVLRGPWSGPLRAMARVVRRRRFRSSDYWEKRYAAGGDSGVGSFGVLARFKAEALNSLVERLGVESVIELGCGDGNQLSLYRFPAYVGVDVSPTAIRMCRDRFAGDETKRFLLYSPTLRRELGAPAADLSLSVDVIYHLVEDEVFYRYLDDLFAMARRYVVVYSTDFDREYDSPHQVDRAVTTIIRGRHPDFDLIETVVNPHKGEESMADFFVYRRRGASTEGE